MFRNYQRAQNVGSPTRTVDGDYLYYDVKIVHLPDHQDASERFRAHEWVINWPDGTHTGKRTLNACKEVIKEAVVKGTRGFVKGSVTHG